MNKIKAILKKKRWRNYGLWAALFSLLGLWLSDCGVLDAGKYQQYINALLSLLAAAGIINNPSLGNGYFDDKGEDE